MFSVISRTDARRNTQGFLPRAVGADTRDATCPSAQPDAAQGAEQHLDGTANGPLPKAGRGRMTPLAGWSFTLFGYSHAMPLTLAPFRAGGA